MAARRSQILHMTGCAMALMLFGAPQRLATATTGTRVVAAPQASGDPLPSWNDGASRKAVLDFVTRVTQSGGSDFVPPSERIATFDNDRTLWSEQPIHTQLAFALDRVKTLAPTHPEWTAKQKRNPAVARVARKAAVCGFLCVALATGLAAQTTAFPNTRRVFDDHFGNEHAQHNIDVPVAIGAAALTFARQAGSAVLFQPPTFFERYRWYVIGGLLVLAAQLALIVFLLVQRTRLGRAEDESRKDRDRYQGVVDSRSELIWRMLPDTTLTFVNDAYCRFWGRRRDELTGTKFIGVVPTWAHQKVRDAISRPASGVDSAEHPVVLSDGTLGWQRWVCQPIVDGHGRVVEWQGIGRDITDQKRAEESLGDLEARNSAILRAIPDLMFVLRRDGTYVDYHARDPRLLFLPPERVLGRTVRDIMPPALAGMLMDAIERAFRGDDPVIVEYALQRDELRYFEARLVVAEHDRVLGIVRDVTESKRAHALNRDLAGRLITSQEVERTRIARDLHDGVCQEIASLSVAISHLRRCGGEVKSPDVQDQLRSVQKRAEAIAESVRLLSHGLHSSVLHHIGLVAALEAHCAEVERQHDVHVRMFVDGEVEPTGELVGLSLFRIAQETLRNSARHGHARHASVSLSRKDGQLTLVVADDGCGFDVAAVRRRGAGLGLVSIEERARLVKGRSIVTSRPGRGTIVTIQVPLDDGAEPRGPAIDDAKRAVRSAVNRPADDEQPRT